MDPEQVDGSDPVDDHRRKPRRRGAELRMAIYRATLDELTEHGYANLTMDRVAGGAKASKGSLYRRWSSRAELVVDAIKHLRADYPVPSDTGDLCGELLAVLGAIVDSLSGARGEGVRGLIAEVSRHPELARSVRTELMDNAVPPTLEVLRRGVVRREVRPGALTPLVARVGPGMVRQQLLMFGLFDLEDGFPEAVVDEVLLPMVRA